MEKKIERKNNNALIIIVVVLAFLLGCLGTYIVIEQLNNNEETVLDGSDNEEEKDDKENQKDNNSEVTDSDETYTAGSINVVDYVFGDFDNNPSSMGITPISVSGKNVVFSVNGSIFGPTKSMMVNAQGGEMSTSNYHFNYTASSDVLIAFIGGFGQAVAGNEYIFLLMKDGTLQYKAIFDTHYDSYGNKYFTTDINENATLTGFKTLDGVKDGIKLEHASKSLGNSTAHGTVLLYVDADSFYDLEPFFVK